MSATAWRRDELASIRRHLLIWLLGALSVGAVLLALSSYAFTLDELNDVFDKELKQVALAALTHHQDEAGGQSAGKPDAEFAFVTQVWNDGGVRLFASDATSAVPFSRAEGFQTLHVRERVWRVFTVRSGARWVQAAQPIDVRRRLAAATAAKLLIPSMLIVLLIGGLLGIALEHGLAPLKAAAASVGRRSSVSLDPIAEIALPVEIRPLVAAINTLMQRLSLAFASQRQFIADAAHELRTPLTALKLQAQLIESAPTESARAQAVIDLKHGLARASHLVEQLLDLSRLEPDGAEHRPQALDLSALARAVVADHSGRAEAKGIDLGAEASTPAMIDADEGELRLLVVNLVDNALRYTPAGGRVDVRVRIEQGKAVLEVVDDGPGIPVEEREHVFDRFYRSANVRAGNAAIPGTGLGLAIVKTVAERHRAAISLEPGMQGRGVNARVVFPPALSPDR